MKQSKLLLVAALCAFLSAACTHTKDNYNQVKSVSSAEWLVSEEQEIQELVVKLELLLEQKWTRGVTKESSSIILETIKKIFSKIKKLRDKVKSHEEQIVAAKQGLDTVSDALGNPEILEKLSDGADSALAGLVKIDERVTQQTEELKQFKEEVQPKLDLINKIARMQGLE